MKTITKAAFATVMSLVFSAQAEAATLAARVYENNVLQSLGGASSFGALTIDGSTTNFSRVSITAFGMPLTPSGSFIGQTTSISSASSFSGPVDLRVELTQTDLTMPFDIFSTTTTANLLINGSAISNLVISAFYNANNDAYGTQTLLASNAYGSGSPAATPAVSTNVAQSARYSQTVVISARFNAGAAALNTSTQIVPSTAPIAAVPEPATWAMMLIGFGGIGFAMRRRKSKVMTNVAFA